MPTYQDLESHLITWGSLNNNLRAIIVVGSRARLPPPDPYADLDLIIFALRPQELTQNSRWLSLIARPWISSMNHTAHGDPEWVMICEQGLKVDLVISKVQEEADLVAMLTNSPYTEVLDRGYRILLDKSENKKISFGNQVKASQPPKLEKFMETFDSALIAILRAAKFNKRDDLWRSQLVLDVIRQALLQFIEWHTLLGNGHQIDIWYDGRAIHSWADSRINEMLPGLFPCYGQKEISHSLGIALNMLDLLSLEVAQDLHFPFPNQGQANLVAWLRDFI